MSGYITIDDLPTLKKAHASCVGESFMFKGSEVLKSYAGYLIQYLEGAKEGIREMNDLGGKDGLRDDGGAE